MRNKLLDYDALRIGNKYMGFVITNIDMIKRLYEIEKYILDNIKPELSRRCFIAFSNGIFK